MSYEPTVWVDGDHVTSAKLNKLEQGVNSMSYTPTVWNAGDVVTAEKLNKLEQGVAEGGGGGGGDFNTAEVTLVKTEHGDFGLYTCRNDANRNTSMFMFSDNSFDDGVFTYNGDGDTFTVTLVYVGDSADIVMENAYISSTGAVVYHEDTNTLTVSGDCSITGYTSD